MAEKKNSFADPRAARVSQGSDSFVFEYKIRQNVGVSGVGTLNGKSWIRH